MADKTTVKTETKTVEREYIIPLRRSVNRVPRYKRANKAVKTIKEFLVRHMKIRDGDLNKIKIDRYLNEFIWSRGIRNPPAKIKVKVSMVGENVITDLAEMPKEYEFKKAKLVRRSEKAAPAATTPKKTETEEKKEATEEDKKEEKEKKASVVEAGRKMEKQMGKKAKHNTQDQKKKQTTPHRMALQK